jgi:hypothetical protein
MTTIKILFILFGTVLFASSLYGQTELQVDEVQVIKDFEARLKDFRKVKMEPILPVYDISERKYTYSISSKPLKLEYDKPSIRPLALPDVPAMTLKRGSIDLAYGVPNAFMGSFNYGASKEEFASGMAIRHHSANNKSVENQKFSHNSLDFNISNTFSNDVYFKGNAMLNLDYINLYGIVANEDTTIDYNSPQRRLIHWDLGTFFEKKELTESIDASGKVKHQLLHNNIEGLAENNFFLGAQLDYLINDQFKVSLPLSSSISLSQVSGGHSAFYTQPAIKYTQPYFNIEIGADIAYFDTMTVYPELSISLNKLLGYFDIFIGMGQHAYLNNSYVKVMENPFYHMAGDSIKLTYENGYFGGLRGDIEGAKFEIALNYTQEKNAHLFVPSTVDERQFDVRYDQLSDFSIEGSLSYEITRNISLTGTIAKHFYNPATELKAWHRPDLEADFSARFSFFNNKLLVDGGLAFASGLNYPDLVTGQSVDLPIIFDVSGKAQYELFKNFRIFAQWNNITATKYNRWYQYPTYRIHLIGGLRILL